MRKKEGREEAIFFSSIEQCIGNSPLCAQITVELPKYGIILTFYSLYPINLIDVLSKYKKWELGFFNLRKI